MSAKTGIEGTYCWIPVAQELPDDSETVLICNLQWNDPVCSGYLSGEDWIRIGSSEPILDGRNWDNEPDVDFDAPTHWMRFPEPSGVAIIPTIERPSDFRLAHPDNPFAVKEGITCGVEDRCRVIKSFTAMQCLDALCLPDLGKVVKRALEVRLRKIAKEGTK